MAKRSSIEILPADILEQLQALLRDPRVSQLEATAEINAILEQQGHETVSKSAVNRYSMKMADVGKKLQESREVSKMWIGKLGNEPQGEVGKLLNEIIRTIAFNSAMKLTEDDGFVDPKMISHLALAVQRLEAATSINEERDTKIRQKATLDAAEKAEKSLASQGMSKEAIEVIKNQILGLS